MGVTSGASQQSASENIKITNLAVSTSETSHSLQQGTVQLWIRARGLDTFYISFVSGETSTKYLTISPGCTFSLDGVSMAGKIVYIRSDKASGIAEILETY